MCVHVSWKFTNNSDDHNSMDSQTPTNLGDCTQIPPSTWLQRSLSLLLEIWPYRQPLSNLRTDRVELHHCYQMITAVVDNYLNKRSQTLTEKSANPSESKYIIFRDPSLCDTVDALMWLFSQCIPMVSGKEIICSGSPCDCHDNYLLLNGIFRDSRWDITLLFRNIWYSVKPDFSFSLVERRSSLTSNPRGLRSMYVNNCTNLSIESLYPKRTMHCIRFLSNWIIAKQDPSLHTMRWL